MSSLASIACKRADGIFVKLLVNFTIRKKPLTYFETGRPFDKRFVLGKEKVVCIRAVYTPNLVDVAKTFGDEQSGICSIPF
jgi:hypothetical protein